MAKGWWRGLVLPLAALTLLGALAWPQAGGVTATVKFPFQVGKESLPAGKYRIYAVDSRLMIRNVDTGRVINVTYLTRLSSREGGSQVVFDRDAGTFFLSEIYLPGTDGYHLQGAPGKHTHVKVEGH